MVLTERIQRVKSARRHTDAGLEAYRRGDLVAAEKEFDSALWFAAGLGTVDDSARRAYLNMAVVYIEQGKYHEGRQVLRQALATGASLEAPEAWEPVPLWGFYADSDTPAPVVLKGLRRTLQKHALDPARALRDLAAFEQRSRREGSAARLLELANSL